MFIFSTLPNGKMLKIFQLNIFIFPPLRTEEDIGGGGCFEYQISKNFVSSGRDIGQEEKVQGFIIKRSLKKAEMNTKNNQKVEQQL